jgi:hypothetical protein
VKRVAYCLLLLIVCFLPPKAFAQSDFAKAMKNIFGNQYAGYQWLDYPLNNYGLATMYESAKPSGSSNRKVVQVKPVKVETLCATFECLGIDPAPVPIADTGVTNRWLNLSPKSDGSDPFATVGCGASLNHKDFENKSTIAVNALLPTVLKTLKISGSFTNDRSVTINGDVSVTCDRRLLPGVMSAFLKNIKDDRYGIAEAFKAGNLIVIEQDLVIQNFTLTVSRGSALAGKLSANAGSATSATDSKNTAKTADASTAAGISQSVKVGGSQAASDNKPDKSTNASATSSSGSQTQEKPPASSNSPTVSKGSTSASTTSSTPGISVEVTKNNSGDYVLKTTSPLIVGILARQEPRGAGIGGASFMFDVSKWATVPISVPQTVGRP